MPFVFVFVFCDFVCDVSDCVKYVCGESDCVTDGVSGVFVCVDNVFCVADVCGLSDCTFGVPGYVKDICDVPDWVKDVCGE